MIKPKTFKPPSDLAFFMIPLLTHTKFLPSLISLLSDKIVHKIAPKTRELLFKSTRDILLVLLSCRGGLHYLGTNSEHVLNKLVQILHPNSSESCKLEDLPALPTCLEDPDICTSAHLAHLFVYHLQSLRELDSLLIAEKGLE
jgi:hypothetical protein